MVSFLPESTVTFPHNEFVVILYTKDNNAYSVEVCIVSHDRRSGDEGRGVPLHFGRPYDSATLILQVSA